MPPFKPTRASACLLVAGLLLTLAACERHDPAAVAREFIAKGEFESAVIQLRSALQAEPQSAELRVMLADALERRHDLEGAQENLTKALESGGDANTIVPRLALILLDRNELDAVVRFYGQMQLTDPAADASLRGTVALAFLGLQREQPARSQLDGARAPAASVQLARAQLLLLERKPKEALELLDLDGAAKASPWWVLRAAKRIALEARDPAAGLAYMKRAHEAAPWHGGVLGEYGEALVTNGRFDEAQQVRDQLRRRFPGLFWTHYLDALLMYRQARFEEGHAAALRALRAAPDHEPSQLMAAGTELQKGDLLMAERRLQALLKKNPDSLPAWKLNAQLQSRLGRTQPMAMAIKRGLELEPGDVQLLFMRTDLQIAAGDFKPAMATLQAIVTERPDSVDAKLKLASAKARAGDKAAALKLVEEAGRGSDAQASGRAVLLAIELGQPALARSIADEAVKRRPDDDQAQLALAAAQSAQNDGAGAWATTLAVLDRKPAHAAALTALTAMARKSAEHAEVLKRHQAAVDAGTQSPQTYLDYASLVTMHKDRSVTPLAVLEGAVQKVPMAVPLREALVEQLLRQGDADRAISTAETGATMVNASPAAAALLATTYERLGKTTEATEAWRKLVNAYPQRGDWRLKLAQLEAAGGREDEASKLLQGLVEERPFDIQPYLALAQLQARSSPDRALETARRLEGQPGLKSAGLLLAGDVLASAGRTDEALAQFDLAAKAGAGSNAALRVVQVLDRSGRQDAAERELASALKLKPDDPTLVAEAARRAQARGDLAEAVNLFQKLVHQSPNNAYLLNDLAWAQLAAGRAEALANARRAAALMPNHPNVLHTLGQVLAQAGKANEAVDALRAAANLAPKAEMPRLHLAQQLVATGDKIGAAQVLRGVAGESLSAADKASLGKLKSELGLS